MGPRSLYPILDAEMAAARGHDLVACAQGFTALGMRTQQLRAKTIAGGAFLRLADALQAVVPELIINDRADVALLSGAAGVHVGQTDLPIAAARAIGCKLVGVSTHNLEQVRTAAEAKPDYLAVGPVFSTASKARPDPVVGIQFIERARTLWHGPLVAIGGIGPGTCAAVWAAGADAVAVISALWHAADPVGAAEQFLAAAQNPRD